MRNKKIIVLNIFIILSVFVVSSCSFLEPDLDKESGESGESGDSGVYLEDYNIVDGNIILDESKQAEYYKEWLENTKDITEQSYAGRPDLWGGGEISVYLWFDNDSKELWYDMVNLAITKEPAYYLASEKEGKLAFLDGHTAIMYLTATTSGQMYNTIFIVRVLDDKIYRTENAWGWGEKITTWDGLTIPEEELSKLVVVNEKMSTATPEPEEGELTFPGNLILPDDLDTSTSVGSIELGIIAYGTWISWDTITVLIKGLGGGVASDVSGTIYTEKSVQITISTAKIKVMATLNTVDYTANAETVEMKLISAVDTVDPLIIYTAAEVQQLFNDYGENSGTLNISGASGPYNLY